MMHLVRACKRYISTSVIRKDASYVLNFKTMNPHIREMEFAVRGPIVIRGEQLEYDLKNVGNYNILHIRPTARRGCSCYTNKK